MKRICSYCGRHAEIHGQEHLPQNTHTFCARCTLCVYYAGEAHIDGTSLQDWLKENPEDEQEFLNVLKEEMAHAVVWEGKDPEPVDGAIQALYREYVRRANAEIQAELKKGGPDRR